jgi:hypothetical protein
MKIKRSGLLLLLLPLQAVMATGSLLIDPIAEHVAVSHYLMTRK